MGQVPTVVADPFQSHPERALLTASGLSPSIHVGRLAGTKTVSVAGAFAGRTATATFRAVRG